jgi:hypothetical protein
MIILVLLSKTKVSEKDFLTFYLIINKLNQVS